LLAAPFVGAAFTSAFSVCAAFVARGRLMLVVAAGALMMPRGSGG
jgi:hypothetical protein